jgi:hypothetical protein
MNNFNIGDTVCYTYTRLDNGVVRGVGRVISTEVLCGTFPALAIQPEGTEGWDAVVRVQRSHCLRLETQGERLERLTEQAIAEDKAENSARLDQAIKSVVGSAQKLRTGFYYSALAQ